MKKLIRYISAAVFCLSAAVSCNFLDEPPTTSLVGENVFINEESAKSALFGAYSRLREYLHSPFTQGVCGADILQHNARATEVIDTYNHTLFSITSTNSSHYGSVFKGISNANQFIENMENSSLPDEMKKYMVGEARFLRANWYFHAVRLWGDVPLMTKAPTTADEAYKPRTRYQEVYKAILEDLDYAFENCLTWDQLGNEGVAEGRVCNYAAKALKAKVLVQMACYMESPADQWFDINNESSSHAVEGDRYPDFSDCGIKKDDVKGAWQAAYDCAKDVIDNGPFRLEPDYANLFRYDPENHPEDYYSRERIFVINISSKTGDSALQWVSISMPKYPFNTLDTSNNAKSQGQSPTRLTWEKWCEKYNGEIHYAKSTKYPADMRNMEPDADGNLATENYHYYTETPDPRLSITYWYSSYKVYTGQDHASTSNTKCYPDESQIVLSSGATSASSNAVPVWAKGVSHSYRGNNTGGDADFYVFRYADLLLLAAESAASLGKNTEAIGYVNQVLKRARMSTSKSAVYPHTYDGVSEALAPADWDAGDYEDKETLIEAILWERVFELDHECHSFFDTRRRGANFYVKTFVKPMNDFYRENANYGWSHSSYYQADKEYAEDIQTVRKGLLLAFPDEELRANLAIGYEHQNDFWLQ